MVLMRGFLIALATVGVLLPDTVQAQDRVVQRLAGAGLIAAGAIAVLKAQPTCTATRVREGEHYGGAVNFATPTVTAVHQVPHGSCYNVTVESAKGTYSRTVERGSWNGGGFALGAGLIGAGVLVGIVWPAMQNTDVRATGGGVSVTHRIAF